MSTKCVHDKSLGIRLALSGGSSLNFVFQLVVLAMYAYKEAVSKAGVVLRCVLTVCGAQCVMILGT